MNTRPLGHTDLVVSPIGLGAGPLGDARLEDAAAERVVCAAIDLGITLIDTAPGYGHSEDRIGRALKRSQARGRIVLSTKLGYGVPGVPDWTGACITAGVELALHRLGTSWIDVAHLHSCPVEILERGDVIDPLERAVTAGKVRVAAYSGDNAALAWAIASGRFGVVQCSVSIADQRALDRAIGDARARGIGVLAKRPLMNGAWGERERPQAQDRATYWDRLRALDLGAVTLERALGFVLAQPVSSVLVGTTRLDHLEAILACAERASDPVNVDAIRAAFTHHDHGWDGVV